LDNIIAPIDFFFPVSVWRSMNMTYTSSQKHDYYVEHLRQAYPDKFIPADEVYDIFKYVHRGDRIYFSSACGEPQFLLSKLVEYVRTRPKAFFDVELFHIWTMGRVFRETPYIDEQLQANFRQTTFFIGHGSRDAVNRGLSDYVPIFFPKVVELFRRKAIPIDVAFVQTSLPDRHGFVSLGVSCDITKVVVDNARIVIAQVNPNMPRVHGDGFVNLKDVDFIIPFEEPILEYREKLTTEKSVIQRISHHLSSLIQNGDTIQVGYSQLLNEIIPCLEEKKDLGIHTELLSDGLVYLMQKGAVNNSRKTINAGKTIATVCMGSRKTYEYIHDNPAIEFKTIDYTNSPLIIAQNSNMTAINSVLEVDLTGQATSESIGKQFYAGIGGIVCYVRGATLSPRGKSIVVLESTTSNGEVSRIVPCMSEGAGVTLNRGDVHYVVTEYGIAYLHGKNIRERAMALISIAHPNFRPLLIEKAKECGLIYRDQTIVTGEGGKYPEHLEQYRTTKKGLEIFMRPIKISDENLLKNFFHSLSDRTIYQRFSSMRTDMPHDRLLEYVVVDYTNTMSIMAILRHGSNNEEMVGLGQYFIHEDTRDAEVALVVTDKYQNRGIGTELLYHLSYIARNDGLHGFVAEVEQGNESMLALFAKMGYDIEERTEDGSFRPKLIF
jgi:acyl-CoA hydrolase/RimJ/RimL family protein N-acetyltransferase